MMTMQWLAGGRLRRGGGGEGVVGRLRGGGVGGGLRGGGVSE